METKEFSTKSRVRGDFQARFCEKGRVKFPPTYSTSIIESLAKEEQAILIVALFLLIYVGIMINVMVREYRTYLDDYPMYHFSLGDFIRRGRFYICLILGVVFITFVCLVVSLMAISIMAMRR